MNFDPMLPMQTCRDRILATIADRKIPSDQIFTSVDAGNLYDVESSKCKNVAPGFTSIMLPVLIGKEATMYISSGAPNTTVPTHSHHEPSFRFIVSGSLFYNGQHLRQGDWMYLPAGKAYDFKVGPDGVITLKLYECCCD